MRTALLTPLHRRGDVLRVLMVNDEGKRMTFDVSVRRPTPNQPITILKATMSQLLPLVVMFLLRLSNLLKLAVMSIL